MEDLQASPPILQFILSSSQIYYRARIISYNETQFEEFTKTLPSEWWHKNDKLVYFSFHEDGSYFCEREKQIYDYTLKDYVKRIYEFNVFDNEKAKQLFECFCVFFENIRLEYLRTQQKKLRETIAVDFDYISFQFVGVRNMMLQESDWTQLGDISLSMDINQKEMWIKYRQYLRDFTELQDWKDANYIKLAYPISPTEILKEYPTLTSSEYLTNEEEHFDYLQTFVIANMINDMVKSIQIPSLSESLKEYSSNSSLKQIKYKDYYQIMNIVNESLQLIDPSLKIELNIVNAE